MIRVTVLGLALLCLWTAPSLADARSEVLAGIARCHGIADDRMFLNCVYGAAQPLRASLGLAPAPVFQTRLVPPADADLPAAAPPPRAPVRRRQGLLGGLFGSTKTEVAAQRMAAYSFDGNGIFTVTLADGQVWRQVEGDTVLAHWHGPAAKLVATVRSGALGSSTLQVQGEAASFKVSRLR